MLHRIWVLLISLLTLLACDSTKSEQINNQEEWTDTIYYDTNSASISPFTMTVSDLDGSYNPNFIVGKKEALKITVSIPSQKNYPVFISEAKNVEVISQDTLNGIFHIIPRDTAFSILVSQDYGKNRLVYKIVLDSGYYIDKLNGERILGRLDMTAHRQQK